MNFFDHQDRARRKTVWLVVLFAIGVAAVLAAVCGVVAWIALAGGMHERELWSTPLLLYAGVGTLLVIACGTGYKLMSLSGGGPTIAESLGGKRIVRHTNVMEQRLRNVVEEMAIASGMPVPSVYLLDEEQGINAFAAGYTPGDAVIGVTRGCAERLTRDQLQGVVAHEFAHIINGDMRLNIRLIGVVHGIVVIGLIGEGMLRSLRHVRTSRSSKDSGQALLVYLALGLALLVIGFVGTLFGNVIRAAVSRQREYLADASAAQLTRNPLGLAGALKVIGGYDKHAKLDAPGAPEAAHMFFCDAIEGLWSDLLATHPPLTKRIKRLDPSWEQRYPESKRVSHKVMHEELSTPVSQLAATNTAAATVVEQIGAPTQAHVDYARYLVASLPDELRDEAHNPYGARAVVCALLIGGSDNAGRDAIKALGDPRLTEMVRRQLPRVRKLERDRWLPLLEMTMPALRSMSAGQRQTFRAQVRHLIETDGRVELFEWVLWKCVDRWLGQHDRPRAKAATSRSPESVRRACVAVLGAVARAGHEDEASAQHALARGAAELELSGVALPPEVTLAQLDAALTALSGLSPQHKRRVLIACARCIAADGKATTTEAELYRGIADALDCPTPPILPGQRLV